MAKPRPVDSIRTWDDARQCAVNNQYERVRSRGSHEVWQHHPHSVTLCNKGKQEIGRGLRHALIKAFKAAGVVTFVLVVAWVLL